MTQTQLNQAVARATGESIERVGSIGFRHHEVPSGTYARRVADRLRRMRQNALKKLHRKPRATSASPVAP